MHSMVKTVFVIIGTMMLSLVLFNIVFGDIGRSLIWGDLEPIFQHNWEMNTYKDGELIGEKLAKTFDEAEEVGDFIEKEGSFIDEDKDLEEGDLDGVIDESSGDESSEQDEMKYGEESLEEGASEGSEGSLFD